MGKTGPSARAERSTRGSFCQLPGEEVVPEDGRLPGSGHAGRPVQAAAGVGAHKWGTLLLCRVAPQDETVAAVAGGIPEWWNGAKPGTVKVAGGNLTIARPN